MKYRYEILKDITKKVNLELYHALKPIKVYPILVECKCSNTYCYEPIKTIVKQPRGRCPECNKTRNLRDYFIDPFRYGDNDICYYIDQYKKELENMDNELL